MLGTNLCRNNDEKRAQPIPLDAVASGARHQHLSEAGDEVEERVAMGEEDPTSRAVRDYEKAIDEANYLIDTAALTGANWSEIRPKLAEIYKSVGRTDIANFVNPSNSP